VNPSGIAFTRAFGAGFFGRDFADRTVDFLTAFGAADFDAGFRTGFPADFFVALVFGGMVVGSLSCGF
jgi:hypothetical protein